MFEIFLCYNNYYQLAKNTSAYELKDQLDRVLVRIRKLGLEYEINKKELQLLYDKRRKLYDDWICIKQNKIA